MKIIAMVILSVIAVSAWSVPAMANPKHLQAYKKAFPDAKSKCSICHVNEKNTKTDHELNAYGLKAKEMGEASKEGYEAIGKAEDFQAGQGASADAAGDTAAQEEPAAEQELK